jgi:hypothetical protein
MYYMLLTYYDPSVVPPESIYTPPERYVHRYMGIAHGILYILLMG